MTPQLAKLEKLKILAFTNVERTEKAGGCCEFEAMFNPASIRDSYSIVWGERQGQNSSSRQANYARTAPRKLELSLLLDGTGAHGFEGTPQKTVADRVRDFLDVTHRYNGDIHEPNYLVLEWGGLDFSCRLLNVDINYSLFDRDGKPLRAELAISLVGDEADTKRAGREQKSSPDLTHVRTVRCGDTLPLLTQQIYGSSSHTLGVARLNDLNHFRNLTPGQTLFFPPLERLEAESEAAGLSTP
ncbi:MAG: hypothetical protein AAF560_26720 [Acidobacteriota bacterium]